MGYSGLFPMGKPAGGIFGNGSKKAFGKTS
jgi:hypothetical protein